MGKGFNNYMCKKFFHPASRDNLKRVWMAEQQAEAYKKKQEELRTQYEKEQNLHDNKALLSKESKDKLSVNFMYELPAGLRHEQEQHEINQEHDVKFEWQRKFNAPRESYCKGDNEIRDQPFGIQVRNVRCIKCHKWGHINTDKECSMYSVSMSEARKMHASQGAIDVGSTAALQNDMHQDGLRMKNSAMELQQIRQNNLRHTYVGSDDDDDELADDQGGPPKRKAVEMGETSFIKKLTREQKLDLLKKMELIERKRKEMERNERKLTKAGGTKKKAKKEKKEKRDKKRPKLSGDLKEHKKQCKSKSSERSSLKRRERDRSASPVPSKRGRDDEPQRRDRRSRSTERHTKRRHSRSATPRRRRTPEKRTARRRDSASSSRSTSSSSVSTSSASVDRHRHERRRPRNGERSRSRSRSRHHRRR